MIITVQFVKVVKLASQEKVFTTLADQVIKIVTQAYQEINTMILAS